MGHKVVLNNVSYDFVPGTSVGILGRNGAGKSTLLRILGGSEPPDTGRVVRKGKISWPLGFRCGFNSVLSGRENLKFTCRLYDEDYKRVTAFVEDFAELGEYIDMPVGSYSSGMMAKLAFGLSMSFKFDFFLIDEITAVGDAVFRKKSNAYFEKRKEDATLIVVSHDMQTIRRLCQKYLVLYKGQLIEFTDNLEAEKFYQDMCCAGVK